MLGCNVDARRSRDVDVRRGAGIESKDGDGAVAGRLLRQDKRRSIRVCHRVARPRQCSSDKHNFRTRDSQITGGHARTLIMSSAETFTPTPEQVALREARRLKKQKAKAEAHVASSKAPLVNLSKGQITPRSWLTIQDDHQTSSRPVRIMTWNVRGHSLFGVLCRTRDTLGRTDAAIFQLLAQCLVREWRSVMAVIERELYLENTKAASFFPTVTV
jgi:hypothetical protein